MDIFGEDRAFLPMTLDGAMAEDAATIEQIPHYCEIMPDDEMGRTVISTDRLAHSDIRNYDRMVKVRLVPCSLLLRT